MKKVILSTVLLSAIVLGNVAKVDAVVKSATTKGDIEFVDGKGDGDPLDPGDKEDPDLDTDPEKIEPDEDSGKTEGALRFAYVPAISFGDNNMIKVSGKANYYAKYQDVTLASDKSKVERATFFQVDDSRGGGKGWKVTLSNNGKFTVKDNPSATMDANLYIRDMSVRSNSGITETTQFPELVNVEPTSMNLSSYTKISSETAQAVTIAKADGAKKAGYGSWSFRMGTVDNKINQEVNNGGTNKETEERNPAVALEVLPGMKETGVKYETVLTWSIDDTL